MSVLQRVVESPPGIRWHWGRLWTRLVLRRTFAHLGDGTVVVSPRVLRGVDRISIGDDCAIYEGVWLQCEDGGRITIGDCTYLGHGVHVHSGDPVRIGGGCVLADGVLVTSADHARDDRHDTGSTGPVTIADDVFIGERAIVLGGVSIGAGATVAAAAVVTRDVPAGTVVAGVPARTVTTTPVEDGAS
jgi:acetyltransferase-like isoleucine patch superfamily enzyme